MNLKHNVLYSLLKNVNNSNANTYELNKELDSKLVEYIKQLTKSSDNAKDQPLVYENEELITHDWLKREPLLKVIFETLLANIMPYGLNDHYYRIDGQLLDANKISIIQNILDNLEFDRILYEVVTQLIISGQVGVMILDLTDVQKLLDAVNKKEFMTTKENYDFKEEIMLERDLSYIKSLKGDSNKDKKVLIEFDDKKIAYVKLLVVHKSRIIPLRFAHYVLGYLIAGNPYTDDLSKSLHQTQPTISDESPYHTQYQEKSKKDRILEQIKKYLSELSINIDEATIKSIEEKINQEELTVFVPASQFELIKLPDIYEKGLINVFVPFVTSVAIIRNVLVQQLIKAQNLVTVKVDISNITKAYVGEYIQNVINQLRNKLYAVSDNNIPITALPSMITPLNYLFIPTYGGNSTMDINVIDIPFQNDIVTMLDAIMQNLSKQLGMSPAVLNMDAPDQTSLAQINHTLYNKVTHIQNILSKNITNLVYKILKQINNDLYLNFYALFNASLNKSYHLIFTELNDILNTISMLAQTIKGDPELKPLLEKVVGTDLMKLIDEDKLIYKFNKVKDELFMQNNEEEQQMQI